MARVRNKKPEMVVLSEKGVLEITEELIGSMDASIVKIERDVEELRGRLMPEVPDEDDARGLKRQDRHTSKQDHGTPWEFIRAVEKRWGPIVFDLAADEDNAKAPAYYDAEADTLSKDWLKLPLGNKWLNPEFKDIAPYAQKCAEALTRPGVGGRGNIFLLTPASIGSEWFNDFVHQRALVIGIRPRLSFSGMGDPYPKDLMLSVYGENPGFETWRWRP